MRQHSQRELYPVMVAVAKLGRATSLWVCSVAAMVVGVATGHGHACDLPVAQTRVVAQVTGADTLLLDDGSEVVLIGALPPELINVVSTEQATWQPTETTKAALTELVTGQAVELAFAGRKLDRYGRQLAQVYRQQGADRIWIQGELIGRGLARAYSLPGGNQACLDDLLAREHVARAERLGHWSNGIFQDRDANDARDVVKYRDTFQIIEGRVSKTAKIRGQTVLDFGPDTRSDFSVWLLPRTHLGAKSELFVGKRVRVRGWVEVRRGPRIVLDNSHNLELIDDDVVLTPMQPPTSGTGQGGTQLPIPAGLR